MSFSAPAHEIASPWNFTLPVHENMTLLALRSAFEAGQKQDSAYKGGPLLKGVKLKELPSGDSKDYVDPKDAPLSTQEFLRGVTWPDDPKGWLFDTARGTHNYSSGLDWLDEFDDGDVRNDAHLIKRSHFGDLQFFHAMATGRKELAAKTKGHAMVWARFNIELALGTIDFKTKIKELPNHLSDIQLFFRGHCTWQIRSLLAGSEAYGKQLSQRDVQHRATGILLHLIQDSFSHSHVERKNGAIQQFHDYGSQDSDKHSAKDEMGEGDTLAERMKNTLGATKAIEEGARLVLMLDLKNSADDIEKVLDTEILKLASTVKAAGPGMAFKKDK